LSVDRGPSVLYDHWMAVEQLIKDTWIVLENATTTHVEANRYLVTMTNIPRGYRLKTMDGAQLRVDGRRSLSAWGKRCTGEILVLDVLVE
jgi:hypothetical protein